MEVNKELLAPCGLYCGVCGILIADRENNQKFKERLSQVYNVPVEELTCSGCLSDNVFKYCKVCPIKSCTAEKKYQGCHQCGDFPCGHITNFIMPVGRKVMLRAIPRWREVGTEQWVKEEEERYVCPLCGYQLFRGAQRCRSCREPVSPD
jgi:hypothetical protein